MAGNKYLTVGSTTDLLLVAANQTSAGAGDAGKLVALNSAGLIDSTMLPASDAVSVTASEAIAAGALINLFNVSGTINVRNADNTSAAKWCVGWAPASISMSASGTVNIGEGQNTAQTGLTVGSIYYLGTAGAPTTTAPTSATTVVQRVGLAQSATLLQMLYGPTILQ